MAKITISGDAVVITSALKLEDIKTIQKYRPNELILKDDDDNIVFGVCVSTYGKADSSSVNFTGETHDDAKLATVTLCSACAEGDIKEWVADHLGGAIINLNRLEEKLVGVLASVNAEKEAVINSITFAE